MMKKGTTRSILFETVPVIIGILIAVVINNLQQRYADRQYLKATISSIRTQNQENVKEIEYALKRQRTLIDTLNYYIDDDQIYFIDALRRAQGIYTPDLKSTTWQFLFENENHTLVSYDIINQLSEIEKYEELIKSYNETVKDITYGTEIFDNINMKMSVLGLLHDFQSIEVVMIEEIQKFDSLAADY